MFEAMNKRLDEIATIAERALPKAAIAIATKLRNDVKRSKRAAGKRRKAARAELRTKGFSAREARARVRGGPRHGSGISITAVADGGDAITVTASNEVHFIARRNVEPQEWVDILSEEVSKASKSGGR